jgi:hypothetical protein
MLNVNGGVTTKKYSIETTASGVTVIDYATAAGLTFAWSVEQRPIRTLTTAYTSNLLCDNVGGGRFADVRRVSDACANPGGITARLRLAKHRVEEAGLR